MNGKICSVCFRQIDDVLEHFKNNHSENETFRRFKAWRSERSVCRRDGCSESIPFTDTLTGDDGKHMRPLFCEEHATGMFSLLLTEMDEERDT